MTDEPRLTPEAIIESVRERDPLQALVLEGLLADARRAPPAPAREKWRANFVPAPHYYNLNQACTIVNRAFQDYAGFGCYLVGSSLKTRDFRDVDVRLIMDDAEYDKLFRSGHLDALWSLMCTTISAWLSQQSGLPIDFQIQKQSYANEHFSQKDGHQRNALGIFLDYPGIRPSEVSGTDPSAR